MTGTGRATNAALAVMTVLLAAGCAGGSDLDGSSHYSTGGSPSDRAATPSRPAVEAAYDRDPPPFLDPQASPSTALGDIDLANYGAHCWATVLGRG